MKAITREWIGKAEEDYDVMVQQVRKRKSPRRNAGCFHAQQCAEKYLKARLAEAGHQIPKTHALDALLNLVMVLEPSWDVLRADLSSLTDFAVLFRYPGASANTQIFKDAVRRCRKFRAAARKSFGLP